MYAPDAALRSDATQRDLRRAFGQFATGVAIVTGRKPDGAPVGVTANSLTSVSLEPPLLLWCLANRSRNLEAFAMGSAFAVHVLSRDQAEVALHFARSAGDKFAGRFQVGQSATPPVIEGTLARIECRVASLGVAGDHTIILGEVQDVAMMQAQPLLFHASRFGGFVSDHADAEGEPWRLFVDMWS